MKYRKFKPRTDRKPDDTKPLMSSPYAPSRLKGTTKPGRKVY